MGTNENLGFSPTFSKRYGRSAVQLISLEYAQHENLSYYSALSEAILCGQKFPSPIPLKLHSAGENNVPEASRKSCVARPSGVSVSGGWCGTPSVA